MKPVKSWPAVDVKLWALDKIIPYAKNPRQHSQEQVDLIARSMMEDGVTSPILVDETGTIIYGHGRRLAAEKNGFAQYPVIVAKGWTEQQKRAYRIKDNSLALLSTWSTDLLRVELGELSAAGYDMPLLGFDDVQLVSFLSIPKTQDPEHVPEVPPDPISERGDIWLMGKGHRVMCGDSLDMKDVRLLLNGKIPSLANCDPPYGISIVKSAADGGRKPFGSVGSATDRNHISNFGKNQGRVHGLGKSGFGRVHGNASKAIIQTGVYAEVIGDDSINTAVGCYKILKEIGVPLVVLWGGNYYAHELPPSRCWFVWDKQVTGTFADVELAWTNCDQVARLFRHEWNGLMKASERGERRVHPTQKPVALAEWVIDTVGSNSKVYLDLFLGSGSSLIACEQKSIACLGMEMSPNYCDVIVNRWERFVGSDATLEGDGRTFAQIKAARMKKPPSAKPGAKAAKRHQISLGVIPSR